MRLLICGGRDFTDAVWAYERLDRFHLATPVTHVIEGEADGADTIGREWAESRGIDVTPFPATQESWDRLGKVAGHMRNAQMLREGKPDRVFVLPGGKGTIDMVIQAKDADVPVTFATRI
jgi:hypothetical protein